MSRDSAALAEIETLFARVAETLGKLRVADDWVDQYKSPLGKRKHLALVRSGELVGHKIDRLVLVRREDLDAFIKRHRVEPKPTSTEPAIDRSEEEEIARIVRGEDMPIKRRRSAK